MTKKEEARQRRADMLATLSRTVELCTCLWPVIVYRNGDGHDDKCPAHRPLFSVLNDEDYGS